MTVHGSITIPETAWERCGTDRRKLNRLLAVIAFNGVFMHVEAWRVRMRGTVQVPCEDDDDFDAVSRGVGADGAFSTLRVFGGQYVLIASPFCM
jgi:hypothetical protein